MYLSKDASKLRQREAQNARDNRAEIVKALSQGQITKRDLIKWGIYTTGGMLVAKHGLSVYAPSALGKGGTAAPRTPLFGAQKFTEKFSRLRTQTPTPLTPRSLDANGNRLIGPTGKPETHADFLPGMKEHSSKRLSYHSDFTAQMKAQPARNDRVNKYRNPVTNEGPMEGRPPGEMFSHQRWDEFFPKQAYVTSISSCAQPDTLGHGGSYFHDRFPHQAENSVWCYGAGQKGVGSMPPPLFKLRYGEPVINRVYNNMPEKRSDNGGFGRNETQLHFHNAHNGAESDGAANVHHFPGTFYDYRWSTTLARRDKPEYADKNANDLRASGPNDTGGLNRVAGDWRELQGTLWCHDHRFFFTAENVYKGNLAMVNMYSGHDYGYEGKLDDTDANTANLRLPSGTLLPWGNTDFDVNLIVSDGACDAQGQYFFDIFTTDGFVGDMPLVNFAYAPVMEVLPRKYRFRTLNASMSRFIKLAIADSSGNTVPFQFIGNDGNLVQFPLTLTELDEQGVAERYDIVVDFSKFAVGQKLFLVNRLQQTGGRKPDKAVSMAEALSGRNVDPCVGAIMMFSIKGSVPSNDVDGVTLYATDPDPSLVERDAKGNVRTLTELIPIIQPVRTRTVEFGRGNGDSRAGGKGACNPDCSEVVQDFPWIIKINGQASHSMNANRVGLLVPKPGEVEHWTYKNGGGGWDHPIHLHFEEGITMNRGNDTIPATEKNVRKDVWRLRPSGEVTFQIQFGEYGGSYVNHCHNTVHEDFAMLMRIQLLGGERPDVTDTPNPTKAGVEFTTPEILPEGDPRINATQATTQPVTPAAQTTTPAPAAPATSVGGGGGAGGGGGGGSGKAASLTIGSGSGAAASAAAVTPVISGSELGDVGGHGGHGGGRGGGGDPGGRG